MLLLQMQMRSLEAAAMAAREFQCAPLFCFLTQGVLWVQLSVKSTTTTSKSTPSEHRLLGWPAPSTAVNTLIERQTIKVPFACASGGDSSSLQRAVSNLQIYLYVFYANDRLTGQLNEAKEREKTHCDSMPSFSLQHQNRWEGNLNAFWSGQGKVCNQQVIVGNNGPLGNGFNLPFDELRQIRIGQLSQCEHS